ncbi:hypothetical protein A2996_00375 [Candidatus Campbellbacteria bacterium RIFCSPLOWO2_01_FULL_34_15]|uniref:Uncharacterized protein n=2 Tax=Candidatus Campbelliibacteriota TaxID=1752727 RepID=A0A1F5ELV3_9BACT|nr:MAG: hypothetical protein A2996_00375 [Candidatus Campbellbacteria bacterium RIFCSPLOWO2_01_FULL_34_15]OGD69547.1 MAG: hypothetical protein A2811_01210 [Candidatus Campbellbacteria bacterium RIFCSPHIGHO2_01_FULL_34_10]
MNSRAAELFKRSFLFPSNESPRHEVGLEIHRMDYPFISKQIFWDHKRDEELDSLKSYLPGIILDYLRIWIEDNQATIEKKNIDVWSYLFEFLSGVDFAKIFSNIQDKHKGYYDLSIDINNSFLRIGRYGNCLAFGVHDARGNIHETGHKAMERVSERNGSHINIFIHNVECSIPLPKKQSEENSQNIFFNNFHHLLAVNCGHVVWDNPHDYVPRLIENYLLSDWHRLADDGILIGSLAGVEIHATIVHADQHDFQKTKQWRKGNVSLHEESLICNFGYADDLRLVLTAHLGIKSFPAMGMAENCAPDFDMEDKQRKLFLAGSVLYTSLCMMFSVHNATNKCVLA